MVGGRKNGEAGMKEAEEEADGGGGEAEEGQAEDKFGG